MTDPLSLRVLVTGARGGVGARAVAALTAAGHTVVATDRVPPLSDDWGDGVAYVDADLTDAGSAFAVARGVDAVVHAAAIPTPEFHPAHVVFSNNLLATYNVLEAAVRWGVPRFVNVSSETVPGFIFPEREALPAYVPVDEDHPGRSTGSLRAGQALRRAADGRGGTEVGHPLHLDPAELGPAPRRLRPASRSGFCRPLAGTANAWTTSTPRIWPTPSCWPPVRPARARGLLHRLAGQLHRAPAGRARRDPLRRPRRAARRRPRGCLGHQLGQGRAHARLRAQALLARLPRRERAAAAMRACASSATGEPSSSVPGPEPGPGEVVVEMKAAGLCGSDLHHFRAPASSGEVPGFVIGHQPCGVVVALGQGTRGVRVGERVVVNHHYGCGRCFHCRAGAPKYCAGVHGTYGVTADGADAHYMAARVSALIPLPDALSFEDGSAAACGAGTAFGALSRLQLLRPRRDRDLRPGTRRSRRDAAGERDGRSRHRRGPGRASASRWRGRTAPTTSSTPGHGDLADAVRALTGGRGADATLDCSGSAAGGSPQSTPPQCAAACASSASDRRRRSM